MQRGGLVAPAQLYQATVAWFRCSFGCGECNTARQADIVRKSALGFTGECAHPAVSALGSFLVLTGRPDEIEGRVAFCSISATPFRSSVPKGSASQSGGDQK